MSGSFGQPVPEGLVMSAERRSRMTEQYTPTTDEMRWVYVRADRAALSREEYEAEFNRWLAEVRREAAEEAWDRCVGEMPIDPDWKNFYGDNNPYRREREEQ